MLLTHTLRPLWNVQLGVDTCAVSVNGSSATDAAPIGTLYWECVGVIQDAGGRMKIMDALVISLLELCPLIRLQKCIDVEVCST